MAKDLESIAGQNTLELPGVTRRGAKPKGDRPMTNAERQAVYRAKRQHINTGERMSKTISELAGEFDLTIDEVTRHLLRFALCNRNWKKTGFPSKSK